MPSIAPSDLFLSPTLTEEEAREYLGSFGLADPGAADQHLQALAEELPAREALGALAETLLDSVSRAPDPDAAVVAFSRYVSTRVPRASFLRYLVDDPRALDVLIDVMGTSPFLSEILIRNPEYFHWLVSQIDRPAPEREDLAEEADLLLGQVENESGHADALRRFRRREVLRIAARDIGEADTLESATEQISDLADVVIERALAITERTMLAEAGLERLPGTFAVIGMGKLGGRELNYSSDIDLIFVYQPDDEEDDAQHRCFHKLARALVQLLTEFTDESYLYRVDLRLRPMGRRGNIAYSLRQHAQYYDTWGETFERFALLKARPLAGDLDLGRRFVDLVEPFVYRRYLDFAALEEIVRHKVQAEKQDKDADRDVKIGRGGIREIEVFAQVLQLTYGAENRALRRSSTLPALAALTAAGLITEATRAALAEAYVFLRTLEHRLQIVQEQQTHALSRAERELLICARRMGLADANELERELEAHRGRVHEIWSGLFQRRPGTRDWRSRQWYRVLADEASPAEATGLLTEQGWNESDAEAALGVVRALEEATVLAPSRSMARNVLANLLPSLLDRIARCARPLQALMRLEQLTERTGAAAAFFRTLLEDEALRDRLIATLDLGELAASRLVRRPELLDSLMQARPELDDLERRWQAALAAITPGERAAEIRRFKEIEEWKILVDSLTGGEARLADLQERLTLLAECAVAASAQWAAPASAVGANSANSTKKGKPAGAAPKRTRGAKSASVSPATDGEWVILALGKLGGRELTVHSDLDLVMIYRGDPADSARFMVMQEMATSFERMLEEPTAEGIAYHVDTRLRPEGKKGALAMPLVAFERYLLERAEIWERLAWTRYRSIAGSAALASRVEDAICAFVYGPWDERIPAVMGDIRRRMERELQQPGGPHLEFKIGRGGLSDVDFAVEMIQLRDGAARPELRVPGTRRALALLSGSKWIEPDELDELTRAYHFLRRLELVARLDVDNGLSAVPADAERLAVLGGRLGLEAPAGDRLAETFASVTERVRAIYETVLARLGGARIRE